MVLDLYHGDCLELLPQIPDKSIDAIIADPPYGITAHAWDSVIDFTSLWSALKRVIKPRGVIVLFAGQPFTSRLISSNLEFFRYTWIWDKKRATLGSTARKRPMNAHEEIAVFYGESPTYNPQYTPWLQEEIQRMRKTGATSTNRNTTNQAVFTSPGRVSKTVRGKYPTTIIRIPALGSSSPERCGHPTQKPVALLEYLIKTYTNPGETVLDFCMGSGTAGVASVNTGRGFIGMELDAGYFEIARGRIYGAREV